ncbi:MAG: hypothetical protein HQL53_07885, partial [Magnetococcales bacterium]|nr:hypothetical protein [Magnetococcales bacterium]
MKFILAGKFPILLTLSLISAAYLPYIFEVFAIHNDYTLWGYDNQSGCCHPESIHLIYIGRLLGSVLLNLHVMFFVDVSDVAWARLVAGVIMFLIAMLLTRHMVRDAGMPYRVSIFLGSWIVLLPASVAYILWMMNFIPGPLTALLSILLYPLIRHRPEDRPTRWHLGKRQILGYMLLFGLFFVYPPNTMLYLAVPFSAALFSTREKWAQRRFDFIQQFVMAGLFSILYTLLVKLVQTHWFSHLSVFQNHWVGAQYKFEFSINPLDFWPRFEKFLELLFSLWGTVEFSIIGPWIVGCIILV